MEEYVLVQGKRLRKGYTTGTCAALAAGAATWMLLHQKQRETGTVILPMGKTVTLPLVDGRFDQEQAVAGVVKDGGDDPDVTSGLTIYARVSWQMGSGVEIVGGQGVGQVTRKGLQVPVGEAAINPVPRQMIRQAVLGVLSLGGDQSCEVETDVNPQLQRGVTVEIFVPGGDEVAQKTFNLQLGIIGGISILGTTGLVEPMSEEAYRVSLALKVKQLAEEEETFGVLVPGNYGKKVALETYGIAERYLIKTSNFLGYLLDSCVEQGLKRVLLIGHLGKLIKVAGGIFHTHSRVADARQEVMASYVARYGGSQELVEGIFQAGTTDEMVEILDQSGMSRIYPKLAQRVAERCETYSRGALQVEVVLFTFGNGVLAESCDVESWLRDVCMENCL